MDFLIKNPSFRHIILHVIGWTCWLLLVQFLQPPSFSKTDLEVYPSQLRLMNVIVTIFLLMNFYLNSELLVPRLLYRRRFWQYVLVQVLIFICYLVFANLMFNYFFGKMANYDSDRVFVLQFPIMFFPFVFNIAFSSFYRYMSDTIKKEKLRSEKENEGLRSELMFLKSQVSPHFVFNVLNNMVSLARKKSDELESALIQLSSLLRYMLYDTGADKVQLEKEIVYLESYINLQKLRYKHYVKIETVIHREGKLLLIAPMLLIPFVENAFKHGTGFAEGGLIRIELSIRCGSVYLFVINRYEPSAPALLDNRSNGIGLANVRRRLELLYPGKHELAITPAEEDMIFVVMLAINLEP